MYLWGCLGGWAHQNSIKILSHKVGEIYCMENFLPFPHIRPFPPLLSSPSSLTSSPSSLTSSLSSLPFLLSPFALLSPFRLPLQDQRGPLITRIMDGRSLTNYYSIFLNDSATSSNTVLSHQLNSNGGESTACKLDTRAHKNRRLE